jgi:hypothetical protein
MYLRWKRRKLVSRKRGRVRPTGEVFLAAVVARSERWAGKPRQKVVAYLAGIQEGKVKYVLHRHRFWQTVDERLAGIGLDPERLAAITAAIHTVVPRPPPDEVAKVEKDWKAFQEALRAVAGTR